MRKHVTSHKRVASAVSNGASAGKSTPPTTVPSGLGNSYSGCAGVADCEPESTFGANDDASSTAMTAEDSSSVCAAVPEKLAEVIAQQDALIEGLLSRCRALEVHCAAQNEKLTETERAANEANELRARLQAELDALEVASEQRGELKVELSQLYEKLKAELDSIKVAAVRPTAVASAPGGRFGAHNAAPLGPATAATSRARVVLKAKRPSTVSGYSGTPSLGTLGQQAAAVACRVIHGGGRPRCPQSPARAAAAAQPPVPAAGNPVGAPHRVPEGKASARPAPLSGMRPRPPSAAACAAAPGPKYAGRVPAARLTIFDQAAHPGGPPYASRGGAVSPSCSSATAASRGGSTTAGRRQARSLSPPGRSHTAVVAASGTGLSETARHQMTPTAPVLTQERTSSPPGYRFTARSVSPPGTAGQAPTVAKRASARSPSPPQQDVSAASEALWSPGRGDGRQRGGRGLGAVADHPATSPAASPSKHRTKTFRAPGYAGGLLRADATTVAPAALGPEAFAQTWPMPAAAGLSSAAGAASPAGGRQAAASPVVAPTRVASGGPLAAAPLSPRSPGKLVPSGAVFGAGGLHLPTPPRCILAAPVPTTVVSSPPREAPVRVYDACLTPRRGGGGGDPVVAWGPARPVSGARLIQAPSQGMPPPPVSFPHGRVAGAPMPPLPAQHFALHGSLPLQVVPAGVLTG